MTTATHPAAPATTPLDRTGGAVVALPEDPAVRIAFTGRSGPGGDPANLSLVVGDGDVIASRSWALGLVGAAPEQAVFMQQVHADTVTVVGVTDAGRGFAHADGAVPQTDALVTAAEDVALAVLVADCVPVVLVKPGRAVGVVHAGRRGVEAEILARAVSVIDPEGDGGLVGVVGPAIGGCCYEVPQDMAAAVTARWPSGAATTTWGTPAVDLRAVVTAQLGEAGVTQVRHVGSCTSCDDDRWFSHRSAVAGRTAPGRQAALVMRASAAAPAVASGPTSLDSR